MKHVKSQSSFLALAGLVAVTATIGLTACGKFEIDPKMKGVSTNSNPLKAEAEDKVRDLVAPSPSPTPGSGSVTDDASRTGREAGSPEKDGETLDQVRRLFEEEIQSPPGAPATAAPDRVAPATVVQPAPPAAPADGAKAAPEAAPEAAAAAATAPAAAALVAQDISDEAKGHLLFTLVEPVFRINYKISQQRNEILALKKILDEKKELSKEQQAKLDQFKISFLLVPQDSIEALLSRVDVIAFTILTSPLLLETHWGTKAKITDKALSDRAQVLNTHPSDGAVRFRSGRLALNGQNAKDESRQIYAAELGYNEDTDKSSPLEQLRLTQMEVERVMNLPVISTLLDNRIKQVTAQVVKEHSK